MEIVGEKTIFKGKLIIEEAEIKSGNQTFERQRVKREDAAAVLVLNTDTNKIILTKQFRYAVSDKMSENILEIVAGKMDKGEDPLQTAIRETEEEIGYRVKPENIKLLVSCFPSPGYTTELFYIYYATVKTSDKTSNGGGLESENEKIELVEMGLDEFTTLIRNGEIKDAKTYIAGLYLILNG